MSNVIFRHKVFGLIIVGIIALIVIFQHSLFSRSSNTPTPARPAANSNPQTESPKIVSTKPDPLDQTIIPADQIIEITFNRPLENVGEFKVKVEPNVKVKVELSGDRKTARIIPAKPYELGSSYSISIGPDTKFDGVGAWGQDKSFQFRTIRYRGV